MSQDSGYGSQTSGMSTEERMQDVIFALGARGRYFYNSETAWARNRLPKTMETILTGHKPTKILCCTFGDTDTSWFFSYRVRSPGNSETVMVRWGSGVPSTLVTWLLDPSTKKLRRDPMSLRVVLGPAESYVAWDPKSYRWAVPEALQTWMTAHGCQREPPRAIALGKGGEYFVLAKSGGYTYRSSSLRMVEEGGRSWKGVHYMAFSAAEAKKAIVAFDDTFTAATPPDIDNEDFRRVLDSYASEEVLQKYEPLRAEHDRLRAKEEAARQRAERLKKAAERKAAAAAQKEKERLEAEEVRKAAFKEAAAQREKERLEAEEARKAQFKQAAEEAKLKQEKKAAEDERKAKMQAAAAEKARKAREKKAAEEAKRRAAEEARKAREKAAEEARKAKEKKAAEEAEARRPQLYKDWAAACEKALHLPMGTMKTKDFPQPPKEICLCKEPGCVQRKKDTGLRACKHDMRLLLRASGEYSTAWLRRQRIQWHPDRFSAKCNPSDKDALLKTTTEMFEIYDELIEDLG